MTQIFIYRGLWSKTGTVNVEDHSQISRLETRALSDLPTTQVPIQPIKSVPGGLRQEMSVIERQPGGPCGTLMYYSLGSTVPQFTCPCPY